MKGCVNLSFFGRHCAHHSLFFIFIILFLLLLLFCLSEYKTDDGRSTSTLYFIYWSVDSDRLLFRASPHLFASADTKNIFCWFVFVVALGCLKTPIRLRRSWSPVRRRTLLRAWKDSRVWLRRRRKLCRNCSRMKCSLDDKQHQTHTRHHPSPPHPLVFLLLFFLRLSHLRWTCDCCIFCYMLIFFWSAPRPELFFFFLPTLLSQMITTQSRKGSMLNASQLGCFWMQENGVVYAFVANEKHTCGGRTHERVGRLFVFLKEYAAEQWKVRGWGKGETKRARAEKSKLRRRKREANAERKRKRDE